MKLRKCTREREREKFRPVNVIVKSIHWILFAKQSNKIVSVISRVKSPFSIGVCERSECSVGPRFANGRTTPRQTLQVGRIVFDSARFRILELPTGTSQRCQRNFRWHEWCNRAVFEYGKRRQQERIFLCHCLRKSYFLTLVVSRDVPTLRAERWFWQC